MLPQCAERELKVHKARGIFAISGDGKYFAVGAEKGAIRILDGKTLKQFGVMRPTQVHRSNLFGIGLTSLKFLPDGSLLSTGSDAAVRLWDISEMRQRSKLVQHKFPMLLMEVSRDGKTLATQGGIPGKGLLGFTARIELWDLVKRRRKRVLSPITSMLFWIPAAFSPDGKRIVTGVPIKKDPDLREERWSFLQLWDCDQGTAVWTSKKRVGTLSALAFSPGGKLIASAGGYQADDSPVRVWDASSGRLLLELKGHFDRVRDIIFSPDGKRLVTASQDTTLLVWDLTPALRKLGK